MKAQNQADPGYTNHGAKPQRGNRQTPNQVESELLAVLLPLYGEKALGPGQLVPLWSRKAGEHWRRTETPFELQGYFAGAQDGALLTRVGTIAEADLEALAILEEGGQLHLAERSQRIAHARASQAILDDVGGVCTIRAFDYPTGMIAVNGTQSRTTKHVVSCMELQELSAMEFHKVARGCPKTTEPAPQLTLFAAAPGCSDAGWDVEKQVMVDVVALPHIPTSFYCAQELGLVAPEDKSAGVYITRMMAAVMTMLEGLGVKDGTIYAGFEMGATGVEERQWDISEINNGLELPLYSMPWGHMPLTALYPRAEHMAVAMLRGDFRHSPRGRPTLLRR